MDPVVSKNKFDHEIDILGGDAAGFVTANGWELLSTAFPDFSVLFTHPKSKRRVSFLFSFDDWNEQPPSLSLFDPETNAPLPWEKWPQGGWSAGNSHPVTGRPFLCLAGIREYHLHPSHSNDLWENYKSNNSYTIRGIIDRVWQRFKDTNG